MNTSKTTRNSLFQCAEDLTAQATDVVRALTPDGSTFRILRRSLLRAQAEVLRGVLEVVEARLAKLDRRDPPASEKITIE
jgi:hypothetical protein